MVRVSALPARCTRRDLTLRFLYFADSMIFSIALTAGFILIFPLHALSLSGILPILPPLLLSSSPSRIDASNIAFGQRIIQA